MTSAERQGGDQGGRDRQILDAAALAFHEKGFHGVGVDELGRRAGLSGPALYRVFAGKDQVLARLLDEAMDELMGALPPEGDPDDDLERALRHHVAFALGRRQLVGIYQRESRNLAEPYHGEFAARIRGYTRAWEGLVARRYPAAPATAVAAATQAGLGLLFSVWNWPERTLHADGPDGPDGLADLLAAMVRGALQVLEPGSPTSRRRSGGTAARPTPP